MCRPPEPAVPDPQSYARHYNRGKNLHGGTYGGGYAGYPYQVYEPMYGSGHVNDDAIYGQLDYEHQQGHDDRHHLQQQQPIHEYTTISTAAILEMLAQRGLCGWEWERPIHPHSLTPVNNCFSNAGTILGTDQPSSIAPDVLVGVSNSTLNQFQTPSTTSEKSGRGKSRKSNFSKTLSSRPSLSSTPSEILESEMARSGGQRAKGAGGGAAGAGKLRGNQNAPHDADAAAYLSVQNIHPSCVYAFVDEQQHQGGNFIGVYGDGGVQPVNSKAAIEASCMGTASVGDPTDEAAFEVQPLRISAMAPCSTGGVVDVVKNSPDALEEVCVPMSDGGDGVDGGSRSVTVTGIPVNAGMVPSQNSLVDVADTERDWAPVTAQGEDLDHWIEDFLTVEPLAESDMDSLDREVAVSDGDNNRFHACIDSLGNAISTSSPVAAAATVTMTAAALESEDAAVRNGYGGSPARSEPCAESLTDEEKKVESVEEPAPSDKKTKRMLSNRESARRSRQRRHELMDTLEMEAARLRVENAALVRRARETSKTLEDCKQRNNHLNEEVQNLRMKLCVYESIEEEGGKCDGEEEHMEHGGGVRAMSKERRGASLTDESDVHQPQGSSKKAKFSSSVVDNDSDEYFSKYQNAVQSPDCHSRGSALTSSRLSSPMLGSSDEDEEKMVCSSPWYGDHFSGEIEPGDAVLEMRQ